MDAILNKLGNQPDLKRTDGLFEALQRAKNLPEHTKAFEWRRKCIECFVLAFGTSQPKFAAIAFEGVQLFLRDGNSSASEEQTPPGEGLAEQLLSLFGNIHSWHETPATQCQCLTLLVQLISSAQIPIKLTEVLAAFEICKKTFESAARSPNVRSAARAALTQMLNSYVLNRSAIEESSESSEIGASMDVAALLGQLVNRMGSAVGEVAEPNGAVSDAGQSGDKADNRQPLLLPLDALFSVLSALDPPMIGRHCPILDQLKNELFPLIIWQLRSSAKQSEMNENESKGIGTQLMDTLKRAGTPFSTDLRPLGIVPVALALEGSESARSFYQVIDQMLRLLSPLALSSTNSPASASELVPLVEELWRCALLAPALPKRSEALRLAKRINANGHRFVELLSLSIVSRKNSLWHVLIECAEECSASKCHRMVAASFTTLSEMFSSAFELFQQPLAEFKFQICSDELISAIKTNEHSDEEEEEAKRNEKQPTEKGRRETLGTNLRMERAAQLLSDSSVGLIRELETMSNSNSDQLDSAIQRFAVQICGQIKAILYPKGEEIRKSDNEGGKGPIETVKLSAESTPEDSSDEDGKEAQKGRELTEMEVVAMVAQLIMDMDRQKAKGGRPRRPKTEGAPDETDETLRAEVHSGKMPMGSRKMPMLVGEDGNNNQSLVLLKIATHYLRASTRDISNLAIHRLLNLSAFDPLLEQLAPDANADGVVLIGPSHLGPHRSLWRHRMALFQWFRGELRNCWSSFVRMFSLLEAQHELSDESKSALIEALATFVPLAIELGMPFELHWACQLIAEQMCPLEHLREAVKKSKRSGGDSAHQKSARRFCGRNQLLGVRVLLENAPAALRMAPEVSAHIVRCAQFVWELERWHFKMSKLAIASSVCEPMAHPSQNALCPSPADPLIGANIIGAEGLTSTEITRLMDDFLPMIDRILSSDGSLSLPLNSLCSLLNSICSANENNLFYSDALAPIESSVQLLQRLCQLVAGIGKLTLMHKTVAWHQIRDHLIQCASDNSIPREMNRRAVDGLQEVIRALLQKEWSSDQKPLRVFGWNSLLFSAFSQIIGVESLPSETIVQIGQVLFSFVGQFHELIGSAWGPLFGTIQKLIRRTFAIRNGTKTPNCPLAALILEIFEKFLAISKPFVLLVAFSDFVDALSLFLSLSLEDNWSAAFDQLVSLLGRAECVLTDFLLTAPIALPLPFIEMIDQKWEDKWKTIVDGKRNEEEADGEDYLNRLTDLRTLLGDQREGMAGECPTTAKWLQEGDDVDERTGQGLIWPAHLPLGHLCPTSPRKAVALHSLHLLQRLMEAMLNNRNDCFDVANQSSLTLNFGHFLGELSAKFGTPFGTFCFCVVLFADVWAALALPLSASGVRGVKLLLVPLLSHRSVVSLLTPAPSDCVSSDWHFVLQRLLLRLSVRCVAKGGNLSLVGCALLRNFCALSNDCPPFAALCAIAIWRSTHYTLFPIRLLISQFFVHSTDFSSDLGKMRVSYRLGLNPSEVEECVDKVNKLAIQAFLTEGQRDRRLLGEGGEGTEQRTAEGAGGAHFPSKFAYLFIFESGATEKAENGVSQKLSLGVEQLVDSVLCQQLLVQLISEQLSSEDSPLRPVSAVGPLLASLSATLAICEQFQLRPGLKSLVQKLTGLAWPANLWQLFVPAMHTLLRWHLHQTIAEGNERKMVHIRSMELLLRRAFCGRGENGQKGDANGGRGRTATEERANPFVTQMSSGKNDLSAEALGTEPISDGTQSAALTQLLCLFASDVLSLLGKEDIGKITKMLAEIALQMPKSSGESNGVLKTLRKAMEKLETAMEEGKKAEATGRK